MESSVVKNLLIAGAGHATLPLIKMGSKWKKHNIRIRVVSARPYLIYSGSLPQFMGGFYSWNQTAVDVEKLCCRYGVDFYPGTVDSIEKKQKTVVTSGKKKFSYDYLVINVGAETIPLFNSEKVTPVKPMPKLLEIKKSLEKGGVNKLLIIGGGAAGSELALNISHPKSGYECEITLVEKNKRILSSYSAKLSEQVATILKKRGVIVKTGTELSERELNHFDEVIIAAGNRPRSITINQDFETGASGRILTDNSLQVKGKPGIFAAGDTADVGGNDYQQIGVHAVKQGVLLRHNLRASILGKPLKKYRPYLINPLILSNGPDEAFMIMGKISLRGRYFSVLKHLLDMRWLEKYSKEPGFRKSTWALIKEGFARSSRN